MAETYSALLTNAGLAKIAAAIANATQVHLAVIALGDGGGNPTTPSATQTQLVRQVSAESISSLSYDATTPTKCTVDALFAQDDGGYTIREFGVFDTDGLLIAVGSTPDLPKPLISSGSPVEHVMRVGFDVGNASAVTVEIDPTILLATRDWVTSHYSIAVQIPGGTTGQVLAKVSNTDGDTHWVDPADANITVDVVEENQTLSAAQTVVNLVTAGTDGAAVFINGVRLRDDEWTATDADTLTLAVGATGGEKITVVQNEPAGALTFLRTDNALSEISAAGATPQANARANLGLGTGGTGSNEIVLAAMQAMMPVGFVVTLGIATNPATLYGFGTWAAISGKVVVGLGTGFGTLNATGGAATVALAEENLPAHTHTTPEQTITSTANGGHSHSYRDRYYAETASTLASATHKETMPTNYNSKLGSNGTDTNNTAFLFIDSTTGATTSHTHQTTIPSGATGATGSGTAHENMPPYIVKYVWERTA